MLFRMFTVLSLVQTSILLIQAQATDHLLGIYGTTFDTSKCSLPNELLTEIRSYQTIANNIFTEATKKSFKGKSYKELEYICDTFGSRLSGSPALEKVLDYVRDEYKAQGLVNVREEKVQVPHVNRQVI